jgi:hypothetical protein
MPDDRQHANTGNRHAEFWERDDVRGARNALDVWANCKHAKAEQADIPTLERIFGVPAPELPAFWDEVHSQWRVDELHVPGAARGTLPPPVMYELFVDRVLASRSAEAYAFHMGLLMALYPRVGPYQHTDYADRSEDEALPLLLRNVRFKGLQHALLGNLRHQSTERQLDSLLGGIHRSLLVEIASKGRTPADVFEAPIVGIRVPESSKPLGKPREGRDYEFREVGQHLAMFFMGSDRPWDEDAWRAEREAKAKTRPQKRSA